MRQVNLLPEGLKKTANLKAERSALIVTGGIALAIFVFIHVILVIQIKGLEIAANQPLFFEEATQTGQLKGLIESKKKIQKLVKKNRDVLEIFAKHSSSANILDTIGDITRDKVWLNRFLLDLNAGQCTIEGRSFNTRLVSEFMLELKKLPCFENVELVSMDKGTKKGDEEIDFEIICKIKRFLGDKLESK